MEVCIKHWEFQGYCNVTRYCIIISVSTFKFLGLELQDIALHIVPAKMVVLVSNLKKINFHAHALNIVMVVDVKIAHLVSHDCLGNH